MKEYHRRDGKSTAALRRYRRQVVETKYVNRIVKKECLLDGVWMQACSGTTRRLLFPVFLDPGFPTLACGRVAATKGERGDVRIGDFLTISGIFLQNPHELGLKRR